MSILIQGREMPQNCGECLFKHLSPTGESLVCDISLSTVSWNERPFDCPLVPVPEHGRLGDLDALAQQIEHERFHHTHTDGLAARHHVAEYGHFLKAISDAPTIIQASKEVNK